MKLTIRREKQQPSHDCTLGLLLIPEVSLTLCTLERPWIPSTTCKGGLKGQSCVPCGTYQLVRHDSVKHPKTWALVNFDLDVIHYEGDDHDPDEDRATCLLHPAGFVHQLEGCIAPGLSVTKAPDGQYMFTNSRKAMDKLQALVPWTDDHTLTIEEAT